MTDRYTRTFADFENHPWPGKILPEYFEQIANAGDGNAGLQRMIQGALSAYGPYHVIEGCESQSPGVPTEWTGDAGYMMYSGLITSVAAASGALSAAGSYLIYNSDGTFAVTGGGPTGVILAHNIDGAVYTVNTRYDVTGNFYLPNNLSVYGNTFIKDGLTASGTINLTGTITYIGNSTQSGYTYQTGNVYASGNIHNTGIIYQSGNIEQVGNIYYTGDRFYTGHLDHVGDISGIYPYNISGYETITADTGQFKHLSGFSSIYVDSHLNFQDSYHISGADQITGSLLRVDTANGLTIGNHTLQEAEWRQLTGIGSSTVSPTQWGYLGALNQGLTQSSNVNFGQITMDGNIIMGSDDITFSAGGTVDGIDVGGLNSDYVAHRDSTPSAHHVKTTNTNLAIGISAGQACEGNDTRLHSNASDHAAIHYHDTETLQCDGISSNGGIFTFGASDMIKLKPDGLTNYYIALANAGNIPHLGAVGISTLYFFDHVAQTFNTVHADDFTPHSAPLPKEKSTDKILKIKNKPNGKLDYKSVPIDTYYSEADGSNEGYGINKMVLHLIKTIQEMEARIKGLEENN